MILKYKALLMSLLIVATAPAFGNVEPDKRAHLSASGLISGTTYAMLDKKAPNRYSKAVAFSLMLGMGKELILDDRYDKEDMAYNLAGALIGPYLTWEF